MTSTETTYRVEGRLLEVCTCEAVCPCWVGLDPDGGTCEGAVTWYVDRGTVRGVDVSDRGICLLAHIPGNVLAGDWTVMVYVDDRCSDEQQEALLDVFTGKLGGPVADLAALVGEVKGVERAPFSVGVREGEGELKVGDVLDAEFRPLLGATGQRTTLSDSMFSTIPGSPAYPGTSSRYRRAGAKLGRPDLDLAGRNTVQGDFRFEG
jgi:hypothetical protein